MAGVLLRRILAGWRQLASAHTRKRRQRLLAATCSQQLRVKRAFALMLAAAQLHLRLADAARVSIVTNKLKRAIFAWRFRVAARKATESHKQLALKIRAVLVSASVFAQWKAVADRNVRLKRLALSEPVGGLRPSNAFARARQIAKSLAEKVLQSQRRVRDCLNASRVQSPRSFNLQRSPQEKAHTRYFEMQVRFPTDSAPAPAPTVSVAWEAGACAVRQYRELTHSLNSLRQQVGGNHWVLFSLWKAFALRHKAKRLIALEYTKRNAKKWLRAVSKYSRNVTAIMGEVGIFADIHIKKRATALWRANIAAKYAAVDQLRWRRVRKQCFRGLRKHCYLSKKKNAAKYRAAQHYGYNLLWKALFALCKTQRERTIAKGFRLKSLLRTCFSQWNRKLRAYRLFQALQARPVRGEVETAALWLWWRRTFALHHQARSTLLKALHFKWTRRVVPTLRAWGLFSNRAAALRAVFRLLSGVMTASGLQVLNGNLRDWQDAELRGKESFRTVRLILTIRLWKKQLSLHKRKRHFLQKRLLSHWRRAKSAQVSLFAGYRRSVVLRRCWRALKGLVVLRSKREAAAAWTASRVDYHSSAAQKGAIVALLRNVYRRKAVRRLQTKAGKYYWRGTARNVVNAWKCFHFAARRKQALKLRASAHSESRLSAARYGPHEGKLMQRGAFTAWKVAVRRLRTIASIVATRQSRRARATQKAVVKAWKAVTVRRVQNGIKELAALAALSDATPVPSKPQKAWPQFSNSAAEKSEIEGEIAQLERSIRQTLSAMSFQSSPRR